MLEEEQKGDYLRGGIIVKNIEDTFNQLIRISSNEELRALLKVFDDWIAAAERAGVKIPEKIMDMRNKLKMIVDELEIGEIIERQMRNAERTVENLINTIVSMSSKVLDASKNLSSGV
jgi:hypothetical protein